ncbi:DNA-directed DNA polymerase [Tanacetum coccineum]
MATLSEVSEYLNNLETLMDDGDFSEIKMGKIKKNKEELEMFEALEHKSVVMEVNKHKVVVFTKAPPRDYSEPFMRFSTPCVVDGQGAWDAELDLAYSNNYITEEMLEKLGFVRLDYDEYGRRMVNEARVEIYGFTFLVDFVVIDYANEWEPSVMFERDFLVTTKCKVDFGLGKMRIDLTLLEEDMNIDTVLASLVEGMVEVRSASSEQVKMGKANRNKGCNVNKLTPPALLKIEELPPISSFAPQPIYHPLSPKQKENILEALDRKYKELEEQKPIIEVLENYMVYRKKLDEAMMRRTRLENKNFCDEEKDRVIEKCLPKKMCDPGNFVLPNLGVSDPRPYHSNLTMADNTHAKAMGEVRNVRIQIRYQIFLADFLVLDIQVDKELPLLLGCPFLCTCGAIIDMGHGTMTIEDGVIRHTYFPKPRAKSYLENFETDEEDDWLGCFEVGRDKDGNPKYGQVAHSFLDIEDEMERALPMEAYFNPFKNIIVFKKLIDLL